MESPLLDSNDIFGTTNILLNIISGKEEIRIGEIGEIIETLQEQAGQEADIIWGNGYDESLGDKISVTILATGFKNNPNQILQPKKEPERFGLQEDTVEIEEENIYEENEDEILDQEPDTGSDSDTEPEIEMEEEKEFEKHPFFAREKVVEEGRNFLKRNKRAEKKKVKANEPVSDSNVDNWFFKNFGLGKLFEEDDDQTME